MQQRQCSCQRQAHTTVASANLLFWDMRSQEWQEDPTTGHTKHVHYNKRALLDAERLQSSPGAVGDGSMKGEHSAQNHSCRVSRTVRVAVTLPSYMQLYLLLLSLYECDWSRQKRECSLLGAGLPTGDCRGSLRSA